MGHPPLHPAENLVHGQVIWPGNLSEAILHMCQHLYNRRNIDILRARAIFSNFVKQENDLKTKIVLARLVLKRSDI